jgi:hypothetical protein
MPLQSKLMFLQVTPSLDERAHGAWGIGHGENTFFFAFPAPVLYAQRPMLHAPSLQRKWR